MELPASTEPLAREKFVPTCIDLLVLPRFQLLAVSLLIDGLRIANRVSGKELFKWRVLSDDLPIVKASNGLGITSTASINEVDSQFVIVCAAFSVEAGTSKNILTWLRKQDSQGCTIGGLDTGPYVLAMAGLLRKSRVALHWESIPSFRERFPDINVTYNIYEIDKRRITSAGSLATLELLLKLLTTWHGIDLANRTADVILQAKNGDLNASQQLAQQLDLRYKDNRVIAAIRRMRETIDTPLLIDDLASYANISTRQLIRLFKQELGVTPQRHYLRLRLQHADQLLKETKISISEIAVATGFPCSSSFSHTYSRVFGVSPMTTRQKGFSSIDIHEDH